MHQFCFNDCIPNTFPEIPLTESFEQTLREYNEVKKAYPENVDGIIISSSLTEVILDSKNFSLAACIASMSNKDLRIFAYRIFTKYPISEYFAEINEDDLLDKEYTLTIAGTAHTAINPVIVAENNGILFTLGLNEELKKNVLNISSNTDQTIDVNNLFGNNPNTDYIKEIIRQSIIDRLGNFKKLIELFGSNIYSSRFESGFEAASLNVQKSIIAHTYAAIERKGPSNFFADGSLIKDVTPEKSSFNIYELRIFKPVAYRVYFYEAETKIYLALIEKKPAQRKQSNHIDAASSIIKQQMLLEK